MGRVSRADSLQTAMGRRGDGVGREGGVMCSSLANPVLAAVAANAVEEVIRRTEERGVWVFGGLMIRFEGHNLAWSAWISCWIPRSMRAQEAVHCTADMYRLVRSRSGSECGPVASYSHVVSSPVRKTDHGILRSESWLARTTLFLSRWKRSMVKWRRSV